MSSERHPIYQNALDAIRIGVADFLVGESPRLASAVRNLTTGLLLLCKEKLRRLSPDDEVLIWQKLKPVPDGSGGVCFKPAGKMTVDVQEIQARFKTFNVIADMKRLERVVDVRNQLEHHYALNGPESVRGAFVDGFQFLKDFLPENLDAAAPQALGADVWEELLEQTAIHEAMLIDCASTLKEVDWSAVSALLPELLQQKGCQSCSSLLLKQVDSHNVDPFAIVFECEACGECIDFAEWSSKVVHAHYFSEMYLAMTDGGEPPYGDCPECPNGVYVFEYGQCLSCGFEMPEESVCLVCGEGLSLDDYAQGGKLCSYHRHAAQKANADD
jgi:hypothetical protein